MPTGGGKHIANVVDCHLSQYRLQRNTLCCKIIVSGRRLNCMLVLNKIEYRRSFRLFFLRSSCSRPRYRSNNLEFRSQLGAGPAEILVG